MKIANIMLGGKRGGVEQAAVDYSVALARMGHDVLAITRADAAIIPTLRSAGIPFAGIAMPQRWNPLARWRIARALRGVDIAILHGNRAAKMLRKHATRKNIAVAHSRFFKPLPHFDAVIALTERRAEEIETQFRGPVHIIPNMVDLPPDMPRALWRSPPVIGSMGRLSHEKGFDLFIESLALLRQQNIPFHAIIGGEGPEKKALQKQAASLGVADAITWAGWVADKPAFFTSIDVYCMASRTENFPITLLEAMAHGCPVISTNCGGGPAAMLAGECGILSPISAEGIAAGLIRALSDPSYATAMGHRARARVAERYATPVVAAQLQTILKKHSRTILNVMLGKKRGGLEQAALDYAEALKLANIPALTVIAPGAWVEAPLVNAGIAHESLSNHGQWDIFAAYRLRQIAKRSGASAIICHGNRALSLALHALGNRIPVIAVAHNYSTRRTIRADACFAITRHLAEYLDAHHARNITLMPNMVRIPHATPRPVFRNPPVIGSMGRFVAKKGFLTFIEALSILRTRGVAFHALLGGEGEKASTIDAYIARYQLADHVTRIGWVTDKEAFFNSIDIFVLPSRHEPFGIALIEAMSHAVPVISTDSEGPSEILRHSVDGLLAKRNNPEALADAMQELVANPTRAAALGTAGAARVAAEYSMEAMAKRLQTALVHYI